DPARNTAVRLSKRRRNMTSAAAEVRPQEGHWSATLSEPQSRQRVIALSIRRDYEPVTESEEIRSWKSFWLSDSETATDTPMPRPGSIRFTKQSSFTGRSRVSRAV